MIYRTDDKQFGVQLQIHQNKEFAQIWNTKVQDEETKSLTLNPGYEYTIHKLQLDKDQPKISNLYQKMTENANLMMNWMKIPCSKSTQKPTVCMNVK